MKLKKYIGSMLLVVVSLFSNIGVASTFGVGVEDMPETLKEKR